MSANRAFFCVALTGYIEVRQIGPDGLGPALLGAGLAMTAMIFAHIVAFPAPSVTRRTVALVADFSTLCTVMHFSDEEGAAFYPLILWTIFGNGFRFGLPALRAAVLVGLLGFTLVAVTTPFWENHRSLTIGLGLGTLILPAYAGVLIRRLTQARQRAEAANEVKSTFLTNVSHELRTPLQALVGTADLLKTTRLSPEQAELVQITSTASQTLLLMINDFLKFTGLNVQDAELDFTPTDPISLLQDVAGLSSPECKAKDLRLALHVGLDTPAIVNADARHIREVLLNLVGNALKFTAEGGILLAVEGLPSDDGLVLRYSVTDTGIGISDDAKEKIFERFTQADGTIAQRFGGTGLGLAICKRLVERMSGRIGVVDALGRGSVFWFEVPTSLVEGGDPHPVLAKAPVTLLLTDGMAKGRLAKLAADEGRRLTDLGPGPPPHLIEALAGQEIGHTVILQTSAVAQRHGELSAMLARRARNDRRPVVLIDDAHAAAAGWDPRWVGTVRVPARFTDDQLRRALGIADRFAEAVSERASQPSEPTPLERSRVLIVDDNKTNQLIYSKLLESNGCSCQVAVNGEQALLALDDGDFDLVLMDVNMPVIDGIEATKLQRVAELGMSRIPIIGVTADASPEMEKKCLAAGMDACLIKPVSSPALLGLVNDMLRRAAPMPKAPRAETDLQRQSQVPDIDWQPLDGLAKLGGKDFLREVLTEFVRDCKDLLGELRVSLALERTGQVRAAAHAVASTSANVGALRVRGLALQLERLPEELMHSEGTRRAGQIREAIEGYLEAVEEVAGEGGGRQFELD